MQIRAALFTFCFEVLQFFSKQTESSMCQMGFTDPRVLLPGDSPGTCGAFGWEIGITGVLELKSGCCPEGGGPKRCPGGVLSLSLSLLLQGWLLQGPWPGLWEELGFPTQPSPACLSHPGQGKAQQLGKTSWKFPACPRAPLYPRAAPSSWENRALNDHPEPAIPEESPKELPRVSTAPSGVPWGCTRQGPHPCTPWHPQRLVQGSRMCSEHTK